jgi:hypothetical protein
VPSAAALDGTEEHRVRLTLHEVWHRAGDPRAGAALIEAHRAPCTKPTRSPMRLCGAAF